LFPNLNKRHNGSTLYKSVCLYWYCVFVNIKSIVIPSAPRSGDLIRLYTSHRIFVKLRLLCKIIKHTGLHIYICTNKNNNRCFICRVPIKCETKRNQRKRNETKRNQQKRNETKRNQRNENEMKRNQRKQNEIN
jgi:hypothetical protein